MKDFEPREGKPNPEGEGASLSTYVVEVDFDGRTVLPQGVDESDSHVVILLGYDTREERELPVLAPFPLGKTERANELNTWVTKFLKPSYAQRLEIEEARLRFPSLYDFGSYLSPRLRHEIGYSLFLLAGNSTPDKLKEALGNTGNIFLASVGVRWHIPEDRVQQLEQVYGEYFEQLFGPASEEVHEDVLGINLQLEAMRDAVDVKMTNDWPDIVGLGHGLTYMIMDVFQRGGSFEIIGVGRNAPPSCSTPIGASYSALKFPETTI